MDEHEHAFATLAKKYGPQFVAVASRAPETAQRTYFVIEPLTGAIEMATSNTPAQAPQ